MRSRAQQSRPIAPRHQRADTQDERMAHAIASGDGFGVYLLRPKTSVIDAVMDDANAFGGDRIAFDQVAPGGLGYSDHCRRGVSGAPLRGAQLPTHSGCEPVWLDRGEDIVDGDHLATRRP